MCVSVATVKNYHGEVDDENLPDGYGVMTYSIPGICHTQYEGNWTGGKKDGEGIETSHGTGVKFVGTWRDGQPQTGVFHFQDGTKHSGHWEGGVPILD